MHYNWLEKLWHYTVVPGCNFLVDNAVLVVALALVLGLIWYAYKKKFIKETSTWGEGIKQLFWSLLFLSAVMLFALIVVASELPVSFDDLRHKYSKDVSRVSQIGRIFWSSESADATKSSGQQTDSSGAKPPKLSSDTVVSRVFADLPVAVINPPYRSSVKTDPKTVDIKIAGQASLVQKLSIGQLQLFVDYNQWSGKRKVPFQFDGPEGITLLSIEPNAAKIVVDTSWVDQLLIQYEVNPSSTFWDLIFLAILLFFFFPIWKKFSVWRWDIARGFLITILYILLYITLRNWLNGSYDSGFGVVVDLIQFIVVGVGAILGYRHLRDMLARGQCAVTLDPITKGPIEYKEVFFFKMAIATYVIFLFSLFALILFSSGILSLGGSWKVRISLLILSLILTGISWWLSRLEVTKKVVDKLNASDRVKFRIQSWYLPASAAIISLLGLLWPGAWLFATLILLMVFCWELGTITQVSIAHKMVIVLFGKDRYHWLYTFGTCEKSVLRDGINIMSLPIWFPGLKFYVFRREILEIDKFKIADRLPTSIAPCEFTLKEDGKLIEERDPSAAVFTPGPTVEYYVNIRTRMFVDTELFLRLSDEDRANYQALIQRVAQNMLGRLSRRLSLSQALIGGYAVSEHHYFRLEGLVKADDVEGHEDGVVEYDGTTYVTFKKVLSLELMRSVGFSLVSLEISDANPPLDLEQSQVDLEKARIELETERVRAEIQVVKVKAEGTAMAAKLSEIQTAMEHAENAADFLKAITLAQSDNTIVFPAALTELFGTLGRAATKLSKLSE